MEENMEDNSNTPNEIVSDINEEILEDDMAITGGEPEKKFASRFGDNLNVATRAALLSTILEDTTMTVGGIIDALKGEETLEPVMQMFYGMTIADLVDATMRNARRVHEVEEEVEEDEEDEGPLYAQRSKSSSPSFNYDEDESEDDESDEDDEVDDEDESEDEDSDEDDESAAPRAAAPAAPKAKRKDAPTSRKEVEVDVLAALRSGGHRDEDNAIGAEHLYAEMGIDKTDVQAKDEVKAALKALKQSERIESCGKARGTKYYVL